MNNSFTEAEGEGKSGPTPVATLGDGHSFRLPIPTGKGEELEVGKRSGSSGTEDYAVVVGKEKNLQ